MNDLIIRPYQPVDLEVCRNLWFELTDHHRKIYDDPTIGGDNPGLFFDQHLSRVGADKLWVAEYQDKVVGLTALIYQGEEAEIEPLIVASNYRDKGIGRALLNYAVEQAKKLEVRYLSIRPVARNEEAIAFFYQSGFYLLGHIEMFMDLKPFKPDAWKSKVKLFGHHFGY